MQIKTWEEMNDEEKWKEIIHQCEILERKSDWTQLPDSGLSFENQIEWQEYRENLRSIRDNFNSPNDVIIPTQPAVE